VRMSLESPNKEDIRREHNRATHGVAKSRSSIHRVSFFHRS
jgi:hypothetical protein